MSSDCQAERNDKEDADNLVFRAGRVRHRQVRKQWKELLSNSQIPETLRLFHYGRRSVKGDQTKGQGQHWKTELIIFRGWECWRKKYSGWGVRSRSIHGFGNWFRALHKSFKLHLQFLCLQETIMLFGIDRSRCYPKPCEHSTLCSIR